MNYTVYDVCNEDARENNQHTVRSFDEILYQHLNNSRVRAVGDEEEGSGGGANTEDIPLPVPVIDDLLDRDRVDLKVLHYYVSQQVLQKYPFLVRSMDETALLMLGMLVEQWVEEFLEKDAELENTALDRNMYVDIAMLNRRAIATGATTTDSSTSTQSKVTKRKKKSKEGSKKKKKKTKKKHKKLAEGV